MAGSAPHTLPSPMPLGALRGGDGDGGGVVVGENGRLPPHRVAGALLRRRSQCGPQRGAADS